MTSRDVYFFGNACAFSSRKAVSVPTSVIGGLGVPRRPAILLCALFPPFLFFFCSLPDVMQSNTSSTSSLGRIQPSKVEQQCVPGERRAFLRGVVMVTGTFANGSPFFFWTFFEYDEGHSCIWLHPECAAMAQSAGLLVCLWSRSLLQEEQTQWTSFATSSGNACFPEILSREVQWKVVVVVQPSLSFSIDRSTVGLIFR